MPIPPDTANELMRDAAHRYGAGGFTAVVVHFLGMDCLDPDCPHPDEAHQDGAHLKGKRPSI